MTHAELVEHGRRWLSRTHPIVVTEIATTGEEPDVIGWQGTFSTLIECKASRVDFKRDAHKAFRKNPDAYRGMGYARYYLCEHGVITPADLPDGWGLLYVRNDKVRLCCTPNRFWDSRAMQNEIGVLLSVIRRIGQTAPVGVSIRCYTQETKARATLTLNDLVEEARHVSTSNASDAADAGSRTLCDAIPGASEGLPKSGTETGVSAEGQEAVRSP